MKRAGTPELDPITLAVVQNGLQQVCNEMDLAFVRAAFSPVIKLTRVGEHTLHAYACVNFMPAAASFSMLGVW